MKAKIQYGLYPGSYYSPKQAKKNCISGYGLGNMEVKIIFPRNPTDPRRKKYVCDKDSGYFELSGYPSDEKDIEIINKIKEAIEKLNL